MAKYKIVHYINQFFAGIGGEEKADYTPELREGVVGPGKGLKAALGEDYEIVSTISAVTTISERIWTLQPIPSLRW